MGSDIVVQLGERSYPIRFCSERLGEVGSFVRDLAAPTRCAVLTDENVGPLYAGTVSDSLEAAGLGAEVITIPAGEEQKSLAVLETICRRMVNAGLDRKSLLVALGGGVVGDVGGFAAASYMRGIPCVQVPTTLLAQVDSSVGGKTAVNLPEGKNLVGAFYQPVGVFIDAAVLRTLPGRELKAGLVEVIKYGIISDAEFFAWIEENLDALLALEGQTVLHAVRRSCEIKADVVAADEREGGVRAILNYGHTAGHALEALSKYGTLRHGEAVAVGMCVAAEIACVHLELSAGDADRQRALLERLGMPTRIEGMAGDDILNTMMHDKKRLGDRLRFVLARRIGEVAICDDVSKDGVRTVLGACGASS